jgi:hypothetical protein
MTRSQLLLWSSLIFMRVGLMPKTLVLFFLIITKIYLWGLKKKPDYTAN